MLNRTVLARLHCLVSVVSVCTLSAAAPHPADGDWLTEGPAFHLGAPDSGGRLNLSLAQASVQWRPGYAVAPHAVRCNRYATYVGVAKPGAGGALSVELVVPVCGEDKRLSCVLGDEANTLDCAPSGGKPTRWLRMAHALTVPGHATVAGTLLAPLTTETAGTPALLAVLAWHQALRAGDFDAYRRVASGSLLSDATARLFYDRLRRTVPKQAWTAGERPAEDGDQLVVVTACSGRAVVASAVRVFQVQGAWRVSAPADFSFLGGSMGRFHCPLSATG